MSTESKIRVVGIGGAGIRMLSAVESLKIPNILTVAIDTDVECVQNAQAQKKLPLSCDKTLQGTGGNTKLAKESAMQYVQYLAKVARHTKVLVLLSGLGGGTASIIAPIIAKLAQEGTLIISLVAAPMQVEGQSKYSLAKKSFEFLKNKSKISALLEYYVLLSSSQDGIEEAFAKANNNVAQTVELLASGFSKSAFLKIDSASLANTFFGRQAYIGCACAQIENITRAFDEIKNSPMMVGMSKAQNMLVAIKCPKSSSMNEIKQILKTARESFAVVDKISYSVCVDANVSEVKILAISSGAQNSTSDDSTEDNTQTEAPTTDSNEASAYTSKERMTLSNQTHPYIEEEENTPQMSSEPKQLVPESEPPTVQKPVEFKPEPKLDATQAKQKEQMFFEFDERGLFENTPVNERKGVDLDIPAFSRKRIKITLL